MIAIIARQAVNQRWAGSPGRRLTLATHWQAWAKPLGRKAHAVLLLATGMQPAHPSLPLLNVSTDVASAGTTVCVLDLYTGKELPSVPGTSSLVAHLPVHDSAFYCVWPSEADGSCGATVRLEDAEAGGCPNAGL